LARVFIISVKFIGSGGFGGGSFGLHFNVSSGGLNIFGLGFNNNGLRLGSVEDSGASSVALIEGLLNLGIGVSGLVPFVFGIEVRLDLLQVFGAEVDLAVHGLNLFVSEVRHVGRGKLGLDGDLQSLESLHLVGDGLVESESPDARLTDGLVGTEFLFVLLNRGGLSCSVNPLDIYGDRLEDFVAFAGFHVCLEVTVLIKLGLHFVGVGLEFVSDTFPLKELGVRGV
jgi:hypothetical protein